MGVLKKGFLFLAVTVSLYPVFVVLLTIPWLQRQCVLFLFLVFYPLLASFRIPAWLEPSFSQRHTFDIAVA